MMPPTWPAIKVRTATNERGRRYALWFLLARSILRLPGVALGLRVARIERHDFRAKRTTEDSVSPANGSDRNSLISEISRSEQKSSLPASVHHGTTSLNAASCYPRNLRQVRGKL